MNIDTNLDLKNSFIYRLSRDYYGHHSNGVLFNSPIDIAENYINDNHLLRCYTDYFTNYTGKISYLQLADMLKYCRLYHLYIPWERQLCWNYNVYYINFYSENHKLLFFLKYHYSSAKDTNNKLYSEFLKSYATYQRHFK